MFYLFMFYVTSLVVLLFLHYESLYSSLRTVFDAISFNTDEVFSINPSANVFFFGHLYVHHHKDWLTYSGGTDKTGEPCYNF